jgi:[protein-PII] uridylyltransferase
MPKDATLHEALFLIAKDARDLTAIPMRGAGGRGGILPSVMPVLFSRMMRVAPAPAQQTHETDDFIVDYNRIMLADADVFTRDPVNLIRIFYLAQKYGLAFHPDAMRSVTRSLKLIDDKLRINEEANRLFLEILTSKNDSEIVLRRMNEVGVLGQFVRSFGRIVAMMQFNMYHHYTVDEHLLRCIGILADIEAGRSQDTTFATELMRTLLPASRRILYVALFLHDIAKGRIEDHSIAGARVARRFCPRLGLTPAETDTAAWLVEQHLVMSSVASRATSPTASPSRPSLKLYSWPAAHVAHHRHQGRRSGVWNGWKAQLIRTL